MWQMTKIGSLCFDKYYHTGIIKTCPGGPDTPGLPGIPSRPLSPFGPGRPGGPGGPLYPHGPGDMLYDV